MNAPLSEQKLLPFADVFPGRIPVSSRTGRRFIAQGAIGVVRVAGQVFIPEGELQRFLEARFTPARPIQKAAPVTLEEIIAGQRHSRRKK